MNNYQQQQMRKRFAIEKQNRARLQKINPELNDNGGIYFLTREDEHGFKFAYIGQASQSHGILKRLCEHLVGYKQHIDLSIRKHGLYDANKNPSGWKVNAINVEDDKLDETEKRFISAYAENGYQLRNVSLGGQGKGRDMIADTKPSKGYREGVEHGKKVLARELSNIADKHLIIALKPEKRTNKTSQKMLEKFLYLMDEGCYKE